MARSKREQRARFRRPGRAVSVGHESIPPEFRNLLMGQFGPAFEALKGEAGERRTRPIVPSLPRTTEFLTDSERMRRVTRFGRGKPSDLLSHSMLRMVSTRSIINTAIHSIRRARIRSVCRQHDGRRNKPGWAVVHKHHFRPDFDAKRIPGLERRCKDIEELFKCPHPKFDTTLGTLLNKVAEDHLALDRVAINLIDGRLNGLETRGPVQFAHVDGATIWPAELYLDSLVKLNGMVKADGSYDLDEGQRFFYETYGVRLDDLT
ncbi:MAG: hypothetical protein R3246_14220, partial [Acidimicrobiia bacterium]|nr:hypothetical protein [Acidimicrobiia bacterium]